MAYLTPRVQISQEFLQNAVFTDAPLAPYISGLNYTLFRYSQASEKTLINVGDYNQGTITDYEYPNRPVGGQPDPSYVKIFMDNALGAYFPNQDLGTDITQAEVSVNTTTRNIVTTTVDLSDASLFGGRPVQVGDYAIITGGADSITARILSVTSSGSTGGTATSQVSTQNAQAQVFQITPVSTAGYGVFTFTATTFTDSYNLGITEFNFKIETIVEGVNGQVRVSSNEGYFQTKEIQGVDTTQAGSFDVEYSPDFKFTANYAGPIPDGGSVTTNVKLSVVPAVQGDITTSVTGGQSQYAGNGINFKITVEKYGLVGDADALQRPQVKITSSGEYPTEYLSLDATYYSVLPDVLFRFALGTQLYVGDVFYVQVQQIQEGIKDTVALSIDVPTGITAAGIVTQAFCVKTDGVEIPKFYNGTYWEQDEDSVELFPNVTYALPLFKKLDGTNARLPVKDQTVFLQYRSRNAASVEIGVIEGAENVEATLGPISPDNPLAYGVYMQALNSVDVKVYYYAVDSDDVVGFNEALEQSKETTLVYGFVPMTENRAVIELFNAHVDAQSSKEIGHWRKAWIAVRPSKTSALINQTVTGQDYLATLATSKVLTTTNGSFITSGIAPKDIVRINYTIDAEGNELYDTYTVDQVLTETTLRVFETVDIAITVQEKFKIYRNLTKNAQATQLAAYIASFRDRRVNQVMVNIDPEQPAPYSQLGAQAGSGLRAGVVPHQPITNVELLGFGDLSVYPKYFNNTELDILAEAGTFIIDRTTAQSIPYIRHQLTTDQSSINKGEDSITTNVDSICYGLAARYQPYIGRYNISRETLTLIRAELKQELDYRMTNTYTVSQGNQLLGYEIVSLEVHPTFKDRVVAQVRLQVPYPFNYMDITVVVQ